MLHFKEALAPFKKKCFAKGNEKKELIETSIYPDFEDFS